jgi:hypothetical protein
MNLLKVSENRLRQADRGLWYIHAVQYVNYGVLDLQSLFGLHVHSCTHWLRPYNPPTPPSPILGSYTRALLVSQDRRHLFVTYPGTLKVASLT